LLTREAHVLQAYLVAESRVQAAPLVPDSAFGSGIRHTGSGAQGVVDGRVNVSDAFFVAKTSCTIRIAASANPAHVPTPSSILAFDSTRLCVSDVDVPLDVVLYKRGAHRLVEHRYQREELKQVSDWRQERMRTSVRELLTEWVDAAFSELARVC
jgi:hypothetical protein